MKKKNIIGVIPAAGQASRLWHLPTSKELLPVGFVEHQVGEETHQIPKVVSRYLIDQFIGAGVRQAVMILTDQKLDLLRYFGSGHSIGMDLAYVLIDESISMPHSLARANAWTQDSTVVFGMPDTIVSPTDAVEKVLQLHQERQADLTLGLFNTEEPWRFGMVQIEESGRVTQCVDKPKETPLTWMWGIACWEPAFSDRLLGNLAKLATLNEGEIVLGALFQLAIDEGLQVFGLPFEDGQYADIGTPESYARAVHLRNHLGTRSRADRES